MDLYEQPDEEQSEALVKVLLQYGILLDGTEKDNIKESQPAMKLFRDQLNWTVPLHPLNSAITTSGTSSCVNSKLSRMTSIQLDCFSRETTP